MPTFVQKKGDTSFVPPVFLNGAGNGIRTRDIQLGRLTLYQLSYSRILKSSSSFFEAFLIITENLICCQE